MRSPPRAARSTNTCKRATFSLPLHPLRMANDSPLNLFRYECDGCGACCKGHLIVEADSIDVLREPRLIEADRHWKGKSVEQVVTAIETDMKAVLISCGSACPFLGADNKCGIYPTRPNACVGMLAGDEQCQASREAAGLPPLV